MICLVTGAAGFIGSHLCQRLLNEDCEVIGIDCYRDFYPRWMKEKNVQSLLKKKGFRFISEDINTLDLNGLLKGCAYVFHLAAQAGVRQSWGENFSIYTKDNIESTQKLLEAAKGLPVHKFINASSSSVYGYSPELPMTEKSPLLPFSPYGVTKLAAENLCSLYHRNYGVPTVSLRFFTVYGPGQRPDMAFHKFFRHVVEEKSIPVYGDGKQTRDFTYIDDVIAACYSCIDHGLPGEIYNVGGGNRQKLEDLFPLFEEVCQKKVQIQWEKSQKGDVPHTQADIQKAKHDLGYNPDTDIRTGLCREWEWIRELYASEG